RDKVPHLGQGMARVWRECRHGRDDFIQFSGNEFEDFYISVAFVLPDEVPGRQTVVMETPVLDMIASRRHSAVVEQIMDIRPVLLDRELVETTPRAVDRLVPPP